MTTHTKNTHHLASVTVQVAENLTSASAFEMRDLVAERLKALPTSCEYSGLAYFPSSSFGEVLDCILLLGFSSDKALENWVYQLFGRHIDKPVDKLPGIVEAICRGNVGKGDDWASKLGEPNNAKNFFAHQHSSQPLAPCHRFLPQLLDQHQHKRRVQHP